MSDCIVNQLPDYARDKAVSIGNDTLVCLVVEEDKFQKQLALKTLEALGCQDVLGASSGQEALEILAAISKPAQIIFTDLNLTDMDGIEFVQRLIDLNRVEAICLVSNYGEQIVKTVESMVHEQGGVVLPGCPRPSSQENLSRALHAFSALVDSKNFAIASASGNQISLYLEDVCTALDEHQFITWYQPKVRLDTGQWTEAEALSRWDHPEKGILTADYFIPLLESHELIDQLTWQQLHVVVENLKQWYQSEQSISISVNLSVAMLADIQFADKLVEIMDFYSVPHHLLVLEITESLVMKDPAICLATLAKLKIRDFSLSIDDFGTGYSNFQQLQCIPCSELKIDKRFVTGVHANKRLHVLLENQIALAKGLNLCTVGEGVETLDDWRLLQSLGCSMAQGYFIAPSMALEQLSAWEAIWKQRVMSESLAI